MKTILKLLEYSQSNFNIGIMSVSKLGLCQIYNVKLVSNLKTLLPRSVNLSLCE